MPQSTHDRVAELLSKQAFEHSREAHQHSQQLAHPERTAEVD